VAVSPFAVADLRLPSAARETSPAPRALTTRFLDFWLLGGASILVWTVMVALQGFRTSWAIDQHFRNLTVTAATLALFVNYPHFLFSYKLAYSRGPAFVVRYWWQLIAVPIGLVGLFAAAYAFYDLRVDDVGLVATTAQTVSAWGANAQVLAGPRLGDVLFTLTFNLMLFTIGWHYTKQVFGCMMVYAHFDSYPLTGTQRTLTKWALLSIWGMSFVTTNINGEFSELGGFSYSTFDLPDIAAPLSELVVGAGFVLVLYKVFYANYKATGRWPSPNLLVPFLALYIWWLPQTRQYEFYFLLVPLFHSLQYLPFVYKMEDTRMRSVAYREVRATVILTAIVLAGWMAFEFVPNAIDTRLGTMDTWGFFFFLTAATLFINIHHYFIDNVVWRLRDPHVRAQLLG